jgi:uncharacterized protein (DUF2147 family)
LRLPAHLSFFFATLVILISGHLPAHSQSDPSGVWLTQAGDARVHVSRCGAGICGRIVWLRDPIDPKTRKPQVDDKNQNAALSRRPIMGLSIFSGMQPSGTNKWSGKIYNADDGQTYTAHVTVKSASALEVEGCVGALCGGETWTRVSGGASAAKKSAKAE